MDKKKLTNNIDFNRCMVRASIITAFTWGFYSGIKNMKKKSKDETIIGKLFTKPLTSIFNGTIIGLLYYYGGFILHSIIPFPYQLVIPICAVGAIVADIVIDEKK